MLNHDEKDEIIRNLLSRLKGIEDKHALETSALRKTIWDRDLQIRELTPESERPMRDVMALMAKVTKGNKGVTK